MKPATGCTSYLAVHGAHRWRWVHNELARCDLCRLYFTPAFGEDSRTHEFIRALKERDEEGRNQETKTDV